MPISLCPTCGKGMNSQFCNGCGYRAERMEDDAKANQSGRYYTFSGSVDASGMLVPDSSEQMLSALAMHKGSRVAMFFRIL